MKAANARKFYYRNVLIKTRDKPAGEPLRHGITVVKTCGGNFFLSYRDGHRKVRLSMRRCAARFGRRGCFPASCA